MERNSCWEGGDRSDTGGVTSRNLERVKLGTS